MIQEIESKPVKNAKLFVGKGGWKDNARNLTLSRTSFGEDETKIGTVGVDTETENAKDEEKEEEPGSEDEYEDKNKDMNEDGNEDEDDYEEGSEDKNNGSKDEYEVGNEEGERDRWTERHVMRTKGLQPCDIRLSG